jgi:hypothetical protein
MTLALASVLVLGVGSVAYANICAFDPVPAATLLFPFAAYNYELGADGVNTLFAITNVSSDAQVAHITVWTDYSVAVVDWSVLLTGYDVYTWDFRSVFRDGHIPPTFSNVHNATKDSLGYPADDGVTDEGVLAQGPVSDGNPLWDPEGGAPFTGQGLAAPMHTNNLACNEADLGYPGNFYGLTIQPGVLSFFKDLLQGSQSAANKGFNNCNVATNFNLTQANWWDDRDTSDDTWAYVTVDVVDDCDKAFPDSAGYFQGTALEYNVLTGDVAWVNDTDNYSETDNAVHIEADTDIDNVATPGPNGGYPSTFYARYANANSVSDYREPLGTAWGFRYQVATLGNGSELNTFIRAWKANLNVRTPNIVPDLKVTLDVSGLATTLASFNCLAYTYYVWDEDENIDVVPVEDPPYSGGPSEERGVVPNFLPLETQEVTADHFNLVDNFGWLLFVWPYSNFAYDNFSQVPPTGINDLYYETWMGVKYATTRPGGGGFSASRDGWLLANYNCFEDQTLDRGLGADFDYVDGGGYVRWTGSSE